MRAINRIIIHYSDTYAYMDVGVEEIRQWHLARGWSDIGYHFVVRRDGKLETGRPIERIGAHARGHNSDSIGVCVVGGKPKVNFTRRQWQWLEFLVMSLFNIYGSLEVIGHRDVGNTQCPNFDVKAWWDD